MIIVAGSIYVDPAGRAGYLEDCKAVVGAARAAAGCLDFSVSADLLDDARINVYERWDTDADLQAFRGDGPSGDQQAQIVRAEVSDYTVA